MKTSGQRGNGLLQGRVSVTTLKVYSGQSFNCEKGRTFTQGSGNHFKALLPPAEVQFQNDAGSYVEGVQGYEVLLDKIYNLARVAMRSRV